MAEHSEQAKALIAEYEKETADFYEVEELAGQVYRKWADLFADFISAESGEFDGDISPEALAAWERYAALPANPGTENYTQEQTTQDAFTSGFDRGRVSALAERRTAEREAIALLRTAQAQLVTDGHHEKARGLDAILALPSTPITSSREALIAVADKAARDRVHDDLCMCSDYPESCVTYGSAEALHPYFDAETVVDDLLASGLVKDSGELAHTLYDHCPLCFGVCGGDDPGPVSREAAIREVIGAAVEYNGGETSTTIYLRQSFGVAPAGDEGQG